LTNPHTQGANLSNTLLRATLPSGNKAVYEVQPQHINLRHFTNVSLNQLTIDYWQQIAHEKEGRWYKPGGWEEITDLRTTTLLSRASQT
jgi:hypothetical protein